MKHPRHITQRRWYASSVAAVAALVLSASVPALAEEPTDTASVAVTGPAPLASPAEAPYRGWSSWSLQATTYPGVNPNGTASWLTEAHVLEQAKVISTDLKKYGYEYVNIDAGWTASWDWVSAYDEYGRPNANPDRFPHGMKYVADEIHKLGLKAGIYLAVGLDKPLYDGGDYPIYGAPECSTHDIVYPDLRTTNGWDSAYKIDFDQPCAQSYINALANLIAGWGYDFLKLDGVGPGSFKTGPNYDNRADVRAWHDALAATGRDIHLQVSWSLGRGAIDTWQQYADSWRIDTDVECYCDTLVTWGNSVDDRFYDTPAWVPHAGELGYNNLDTLNVGNGEMDGLTEDERKAYATLWAISAAPLYLGDDLTTLDKFGKSLITNQEVLDLNAQGRPASPIIPKALQQVWRVQNNDGSYTVALFNLDRKPAVVQARWSDLGFSGSAQVRDMWAKKNLGSEKDGYTATVPGHGVVLLKVTPQRPATVFEAEASTNTFAGSASVAGCEGCAGGLKVGNLGGTGTAVTINGINAPQDGTYLMTVSYVDGSSGRTIGVSVNGGAQTPYTFGGGGDDRWDRPQSETIEVQLVQGQNTVTFGDAGGYAPDLDKITLQKK